MEKDREKERASGKASAATPTTHSKYTHKLVVVNAIYLMDNFVPYFRVDLCISKLH